MMKKLILVSQFLLFTVFMFAQGAGDGIRFIEGEKWDNVLKMAREQDKYIFMDCYTVWCGPCKALAKDIFTRKDVGDFFNASFINVKYDMEKGEGKMLHEKYKSNIIGFPTLLLIDKTGQVVQQMAGFQQADVLINGMKNAMEGKSLFAYKEQYAAGNRDLNFIKDYVVALEGAFLKDEIKKILDDYMNSIPLEKLKEKEVWELVGAEIKDPYSPQFKFVVYNVDYFPRKLGVDRYNLERQLEWALDRAVKDITGQNKDDEGNVLPLVNEPEKVAVLRELAGRGNFRRAEEARAKLRIHELKLAGAMPEVFTYLKVCDAIGALGYSKTFFDESVRYLALNSKDAKMLKECLTIMEGLQAEEDKDVRGGSFYPTLALLNEKLGNKDEAEKYRDLQVKREEKLRKQYEEMMKKSE